ncbi:NUDIX domain-containing protein [Rhodoligotrophos defluvii]|uniref:NUDIX domain-containing protein n=1 Tax=Rhodoligotrophos defluvii TaxID=2561934 RepID=UPI0010C948C4|nr:NUDIX hydrolase [Rhodoligotrophos defluvii]
MPKPETPLLTTDCIAVDDAGRIVLIRRKNPPFQGAYALPGGFVDVGETVEQACRRELEEETGLIARDLRLVGVYSSPDRDPRFHTASVVFLTHIGTQMPQAGDDAAEAELVENWDSIEFAFDHGQIMRDARRLLKG